MDRTACHKTDGDVDNEFAAILKTDVSGISLGDDCEVNRIELTLDQPTFSIDSSNADLSKCQLQVATNDPGFNILMETLQFNVRMCCLMVVPNKTLCCHFKVSDCEESSVSISFGSLDNGTTFCEESVPPAFFRTTQGINQTLIALNLPWLDEFTSYLAQYEFKFSLEGGNLNMAVENQTATTPTVEVDICKTKRTLRVTPGTVYGFQSPNYPRTFPTKKRCVVTLQVICR